MAVLTTNLPETLAPLMRILRRVLNCARFQRDYRRTLAALEALTERELADLGLSRNDLKLAAKKAVCA